MTNLVTTKEIPRNLKNSSNKSLRDNQLVKRHMNFSKCIKLLEHSLQFAIRKDMQWILVCAAKRVLSHGQ